MTYDRKVISLNCLLLDAENARHGKQADQNAALTWMASEPKVMALARSIAENGTSPSDLLMVIPAGEGQDELYVVVEGNRRTAALKMLHDPDKCPDERTRKHFRKLRQDSKITLPSALECVVYPDLESAAPWIARRHLGEQAGAGTVAWGAKENEYFARRLGEQGPNEASLTLLEYAKDKGLITAEQFDKVPLTNVTRLISNPDIRRELGMNIRKKELAIVADVPYFDRALGDMLRALASPGVTVSMLKTLGQREDFIRAIKQTQGWGSYEVQDETPLFAIERGYELAGGANNHAPGTPEGGPDGKAKRTSKDPLARKTAIPSRTHMKIENHKMIAVFRELKALNVDLFPNAASVLTRVFIEGCVDLYIAKHQLSQNNLKTLGDKVGRVRQDMVDSNSGHPEVKQHLKGLEVFAGDHNSIGSANTFNAVVHNPQFRITAQELKATWDRLESCLAWFEGHV